MLNHILKTNICSSFYLFPFEYFSEYKIQCLLNPEIFLLTFSAAGYKMEKKQNSDLDVDNFCSLS